jgi:tryptophan synthase alpha subunit
MNVSGLIFTPGHYTTEAKGDKAGADGVIIGSKIVAVIEENLNKTNRCLTEIAAFIGKVKASLD